MSMRIWILQTGEPLHCDGNKARPMRAINLANALASRRVNVTVFSSAFYHQEKVHRCRRVQLIKHSEYIDIVLIPSPGYDNNISLLRFWDHFVLGINVYKFIAAHNILLPDCAFVGFPPIEAALAMLLFLRKQRVPTVIDIKDFWPHVFIEKLAKKNFIKAVARIVLCPYFEMARICIRSAGSITAPSQRYLDKALTFIGRPKNTDDSVLYLTTPNSLLSDDDLRCAQDFWSSHEISNPDFLNFIFVGSICDSFDFKNVITAFRRLLVERPNYRLFICGDGPGLQELRLYCRGLSNVIFPGWIDGASYEYLAGNSVAMIAPYINIDNFIDNIPNKVVDSIRLGLPVISPLRGELKELIEKHNIGFSCSGDTKSWIASIKKLGDSDETRKQLKTNCTRLFNNQFSYQKVYEDFADKIISFAKLP